MNPIVVKDSATTVSPIGSRRNSSPKIQIIPPYRVDLTLARTVIEEVRVPVNISGSALYAAPTDLNPH